MQILLVASLLTLCVTLFPAELTEKYSIQILNEGASTDKPKKGDPLQIHYEGTLPDGSEFDSSYKRGEPIAINVGQGQVIKCWDQVALHLPIGWKIRVLCPYATAYGDRAMGPIPAKANLHFIMERVK